MERKCAIGIFGTEGENQGAVQNGLSHALFDSTN